jgi:hypothetical protein
VRLVKVIRRRDHDGIDLIELQEILKIRENVRDLEALGDRARLGPIVVAKGDELRSLDLREHGKMRKLRYRPSSDEPESDRVPSGF